MEYYMAYSVAPVYRQLFQDNEDKFLISSPEAYYAMSSLSNITGLPLWQTLLVNSIVDITSFCTSIVARMSDGTIIHGRNLDFDFPSLLQPLTYRAYLKTGGRVVGEAICHAGYVGLYTALRYDAFTITYNVRMLDHKNTSEIIANIEREWEEGTIPAAQAIQKAILYNSSFNAATAYLSSQHVNTPCYIIIGGVRGDSVGPVNASGVVITRDPYGLNRTQWLADRDSWYIVQTNMDWWRVPDKRYDATVGYLDSLGLENIDMVTIATDVLNKTGVVQWITIYQASLSAQLREADVFFTPQP